MLTLYFSLMSQDLDPLVKNMAAECESFLEAECVFCIGPLSAPEKIQKSLSRSDVLIVIIEGNRKSEPVFDFLAIDRPLDERVRYEIVSAINLDLIICPVLIEEVILPSSAKLPGAWKRLMDHKSYPIRRVNWREDLHQLLEGIEMELDFKKQLEEKLFLSDQDSLMNLQEKHGKSAQENKFGVEYSGALRLRRVIDTETLKLEQARRKGDRIEEKNALSALGLAFAELGQTPKAIQNFKDQLEIAREIEDVEEECSLLASLGDASALSGDIGGAKRFYEEQLLRADSRGLRQSIGSAYNGLGYVSVKQNQIPRAIECYLKALGIFREFEDHDKELELLVGIGLNFQKIGELNQATEHLEAALKKAGYLENRKEEGQILVDLSEMYFGLGNLETALGFVRKSEDFLQGRHGSWVSSLHTRLAQLRNSMAGS